MTKANRGDATDTATPWYRVSDLPPPIGVRVRVMWDGREFEAARVCHPVTRALCWVTHDRKLGAVFLPLSGELRRPADPSTPWAGWHTLRHAAPDYYQPLVPGKWSVALPKPVEFRTVSQRNHVVPGGGVAVSQTSCIHQKVDGASDQWWRDPLAIDYAPSGKVSLRMAEGRVMRAVAWCDAGRGLTLRRRTPLDVLAERAAEVEGGGDDAMSKRFHPLPQDVSDFDVAMGWYAQLNPPHRRHGTSRPWALSREQRVLLWRTRLPPLSFQEIAWCLHLRSPERPRQMYKDAIVQVWKIANSTIGNLSLAALRERNREAERRGD